MNVYDIGMIVIGALSLSLYIGCVLHYRDLKSAQDIVREVARGLSPEAAAPYQQVRALSLFLADVQSVPDFRINMAKTCYNVYFEYGPEAEFPRYFGRQLMDAYMFYLGSHNMPVPPYMAHLSNMDVGEFVIAHLRNDKIVQGFLETYVAEGLDVEALDRVLDTNLNESSDEAQVITLPVRGDS